MDEGLTGATHFITDEHLRRLTKIAHEDQEGLFERHPHLAVYRDRLLLVALCQGGAQHYVECKNGVKRTNGVKDLDVYSFYASYPGVLYPAKWHTKADFGESEFGYRPADRPYKGKHFVGRHVDLMGRGLPVEPDADPVEAVWDWLATSKNTSPKLLRLKAVVGLYPQRYRGKVIWDANVDL